MKRYLLTGLLLYLTLTLTAQEKISHLSYSIADTSLSQTEQAHALYTWVTNNIAYDVKQLHKGLKDYTPEQTLSRKKAVCQGYSELYHALCDALGIESYIIIGYSKGFGYIKGEDFTRSNHAWNAVYTDSSWILIDPTWGAGSLGYRFNMMNRLKKIFNKHAAIRSQVIFTKNPTDTYFNISVEELLKTHLPADAKWQFREHPVGYHEFISDTAIQHITVDFQQELNRIRLKDPNEQIFIDAKNSPTYNPYNRFDIAYQYFRQANQLELSKSVVMDTVLLRKLNTANHYYGISQGHLKVYRDIRRNFYRKKKLIQKSTDRRASRAIRSISKLPSEENDKFFKVYGRFVRQEGSLEKSRLDRFNAEIKIPLEVEYAFKTPETADSMALISTLASFRSDSLEAEKCFALLDEKQGDMQQTLEAGGFQNDTILSCVQGIKAAIDETHSAIDRMDEYAFTAASRKLEELRKAHEHWTVAKENIQAMLLLDLEDFRRTSTQVERSLLSAVRNLEKLARLTGDNDYYLQKTKEMYDLLHALYQQEMQAIELVKENTSGWQTLLAEQNKILLQCGKRGMPEISKKVSAFFNYISGRNEKQYQQDMKLYDTMLSHSKNRMKLIKAKIREVTKYLATEEKLQNS
ncbi:MAG: hypothetical protein JW801_06470 [Bacteroidales bacterium]|nr:hypothetical protein [Bacteroidales bacterium]